MSNRVQDLAEREARLQERCRAQRAAIAREVDALETRFARFDRVASAARSALLHPVVIAGGVVALLTIGRVRGMRLVGRAYLLVIAARRLMQAVKMFEGVGSRGQSTVEGGRR